ncbi:MAG: DUF262 domain-containing protein [Inquilinus sp.]|nr:DUF262 domain-containing protein [Inquilinus sp.]
MPLPPDSDTPADDPGPPPDTATAARLDPAALDIESRPATVEELLQRLRDGELALGTARPPWRQANKSRLIESLLVRIPLPSLYIDAVDQTHWVVIDGTRRLTALQGFAVDRDFALSGLDYLPELEGTGFDDLPRALKRRLMETALAVELVKPGAPQAVRANLYRRLNTVGGPMPEQEIRDRLYRNAAGFLTGLTGTESWRGAVGDGIDGGGPDDREAALRFLALFPLAHPPPIEGDLDTVLDQAAAALDAGGLEAMIRRDLLARRLTAALETAAGLFGDGAFGRGGSEAAAPGIALIDCWSVPLARLDATEAGRLLAKREEVIKAFTELLQDQDFAASVGAGEKDPAAILRRFTEIHDLVGKFASA